MTDLEITRWCAEAVAITGWLTQDDPMVTNANGEFVEPYDPLHIDAQAMALVKKFQMEIRYDRRGTVSAFFIPDGLKYIIVAENTNNDLNRAICECVAKMQKAKVAPSCVLRTGCRMRHNQCTEVGHCLHTVAPPNRVG